MRRGQWQPLKDGMQMKLFPLSRRQALLTMAAGLLTSSGALRVRADQASSGGQVSMAVQPKVVQFFTRQGAGDKDGRDWQNAMPLDGLEKALNAGQPGSGFFIGFDPGSLDPAPLDKERVNLKGSGDPDNPLFVQVGLIDGASGLAPADGDAGLFFKSTRPWSLEAFGKRSSGCYFGIVGGASHLRLSGFRVDGTPADGLFKFRAKKDDPVTFDDIVIAGVDARNVGRIIETERGSMLRNVVVEGCRAVGIVRGFARFRDLSDSVLRNLELDADNMDAGGQNVCQLISLESGNNVVFENVVVRNAVNDSIKKDGKPSYVQGDGIVCERKTSNIVLRNCHGSGMGDGGFDLKSTDTLIEDCTTESCKYGARIWSESNNVIRRCSFKNPQSRGNIKGACIQVGGSLEIIDTTLQAGPGTNAINLHKLEKQNAPVVRMQGGSIELTGDAKLVGTAGGSGVLELHNVMVNGVATDDRFVFEEKKQ
jgi:Right handed beta helix region